ncbi:MAG: hypothetical protein ACKVQK_23850 [Burkholderiales bacterium]
MRLGSIATGADFFDRRTECEDLWRYLADDHVVVSGPRRLGKSSIVTRVREEAEAKELLVQYIDVEGIKSAQKFIDLLASHFPENFVARHLNSLGTHAKQWLSLVKKVDIKVPGGIGGGIEFQVGATASWQTAALALQQRLTDVPALIFIDEFSVFLEKLLKQDAKEAESLLAWLRAWRIRPGVACRFLFTGSIGLNALLESHGLTAYFNDCVDYRVGPFKSQPARDMIAAFTRESKWTIDDTSTNHLCNRVGWLSPYYLCLLLDQTMQAARDRVDETATPETARNTLIQDDIDVAYERLISARSRFVHWDKRLERMLSPNDLTFVRRILTLIARKPEGLTNRQLHARLAKIEPDPDKRASRMLDALRKLTEEGYISPPDTGAQVRFLSFLLRDYWARNHV